MNSPSPKLSAELGETCNVWRECSNTDKSSDAGRLDWPAVLLAALVVTVWLLL